MAVGAKIGMLVSGGWGADLRRALALLLFLALVTCHTSRLCGEPFSHIPVATAPVTSALTSGRFALTPASVVPQFRAGWSGARASSPHRMRPGWPRSQGYEPETEGLPASHPAQVVPAGATLGCTNGGRFPIPAKAATSDSYALFSSSATPSQALTSRLCSGGIAGANLWLACLLNAPANAARQRVTQTSCFWKSAAFLVVWKNRGVSEAETPRYCLVHRPTRGWSENDPSPVTLRLMKWRRHSCLRGGAAFASLRDRQECLSHCLSPREREQPPP